MNEHTQRILVVDDEPHQLETICRGLHLFGYDCEGALNVKEAVERLTGEEAGSFDLVLTDLTMPGGSGIDLIRTLRGDHPDSPVVVITGLTNTDEVEAVRAMGIPMLKKPFEPDTLDRALQAALDRAV